jgi:hypothetical protein
MSAENVCLCTLMPEAMSIFFYTWLYRKQSKDPFGKKRYVSSVSQETHDCAFEFMSFHYHKMFVFNSNARGYVIFFFMFRVIGNISVIRAVKYGMFLPFPKKLQMGFQHKKMFVYLT